MSQDDTHETPSSTPDFRTELAQQLAELVPEAIADGKVDVVKLQELLEDDIADGNERFGLFWPGKRRALRVAQEPTTATLKPDFENSKDWDTTKNVFIEGDNLEVLKILQRHYHGKIKMIYIDPPYNTGKDFVYKDSFSDGVQHYLDWTKQVGEDGKRLSSNPESEGRYHTNWLNMIYPRLKLCRNLLTRDGVIFISIDDCEQAGLRSLCNEVFGERNFVAQITWKSKPQGGNDNPHIVPEHEYILVYSRDRDHLLLNGRPNDGSKYKLVDEYLDTRGPYARSKLDLSTLEYRQNLDYEIRDFDGNSIFAGAVTRDERDRRRAVNTNRERDWQWRWSEERFLKALKDGFIEFRPSSSGKPGVYAKEYFRVDRDGKSINREIKYRTVFDFVTSIDGTQESARLLGKRVFDFPKPINLVKTLVRMGSSKDSLILDFFAGAGTTGHAVQELNKEDGGTRRYILVQLPEPVSNSSAARQAGFSNIAEISRHRLSIASTQLTAQDVNQLDLDERAIDWGFRAFTLTDTNFSKWLASSDVGAEELERQLLNLADSADDDATPDDLLTEILLKQGFSLTERIEPRDVAGLDVRAVLQSGGDPAVLAYLDEHVKPSLDQLRSIVAAIPGGKIIVLEDAFQGDDELKTNLAQMCKTNSIELWTA